MSARDLRGRLLEPVTALPLLPLSKRASTDSCSILFSLRVIISGALRSNNLLSLLFLLITLLYKSFKSEVANLPPSKGTRGLKSGGKIGKTSSTIHSGLFPDSLNDLSNFNLLAYFLSFASDLVRGISSWISLIAASKSNSFRRVWMDSAPIPASNSSPQVSKAS